MPLLNFIGVEHLPTGVGVGNLTDCFGLLYSGLGAKADWTGNDANYPNVAHLRPDGADIIYGGLPVNGNNGGGVVSIPLLNLMNGPVTPDRLFIGFRWTKLKALSGVSSMPIFSLLPNRYGPGNNGIPANPIITDSNEAVGSTHFYVLDINFTTLKYTVYRDGSAINATPVSLPSGCTKATVQSWWWAIGRYDTFTFPAQNDYRLWAFRDIHVIADLGITGDLMNERLSTAVVRRAPLVSAAGVGYTPVGAATPVDALNTKRASASAYTTPAVTVPATSEEMVCKLDPSALTGFNVRGLCINTSTFKDSGTVGQISGKVRSGGVSTPTKTLATTVNTAPVDQNVAIMALTPDGTVITSANIGGVEIVFGHTTT